MSDRKEEYLRRLTEQIRCKRARKQIAEEIRSHMDEQEQFFMSEGMTKEEAEEETVKEMGDPVEAGAALDMVHRPQLAWGFFVLVGILYAAGFMILYFLQKNFAEASLLPGGRLHFILYMAVGFAVMIAVCYADYSRLGLRAKELMILLTILIGAGFGMFGSSVNGRMFFLGGVVNVNAKLLCYIFVPLYGAALYSYRGQGYRAVGKGLLWMLPALGISLYIPSMSTAMMLFVMFAVILSFAVGRGWFAVSRKYTLAGIWGSMILLPAALCLWIIQSGPAYQAGRLRALLRPGSAAASYPSRMLWKIFEGGVLRGSGEYAMSAADRFPGGAEYGLAYVTAYYGILAAALLIGTLVCLFAYFLGMSLHQKNELGMIMGVGCSVVFFVQLFFYILGNTGLLAMGGFYCPFFTCGGTGVLVTNILTGLLLSIYRYQDVLLSA